MTAAEVASDDLRSRLRAGDDRVTAAMLGKADAEAERAGLLVAAAEATLARARTALPANPIFADAVAAALARVGFVVPAVVVAKGDPEPESDQWPVLTIEPRGTAGEDPITGTLAGEVHLTHFRSSLHRDITPAEIEAALRKAGWMVHVTASAGGIRVVALPRGSVAYADIPLVDARSQEEVEKAVSIALRGSAIRWARRYVGETEPGQVTSPYATTSSSAPGVNARIHKAEARRIRDVASGNHREQTFALEVEVSPLAAAGVDSQDLVGWLPTVGADLVGVLVETVGVVTSVTCTSPQSGVAAAVGGTIVRGDMSPRVFRGTLTIASR